MVRNVIYETKQFLREEQLSKNRNCGSLSNPDPFSRGTRINIFQRSEGAACVTADNRRSCIVLGPRSISSPRAACRSFRSSIKVAFLSHIAKFCASPGDVFTRLRTWKHTSLLANVRATYEQVGVQHTATRTRTRVTFQHGCTTHASRESVGDRTAFQRRPNLHLPSRPRVCFVTICTDG